MATSPITSVLHRREREAEKIIRSSNDSKHIRLVCIWFPLPEPRVVELLSTRWMARLDKVLDPNNSNWSDWKDWNYNGFKAHKAETILRIFKSEETRSPRCDLVKSLPSLDSATNFTRMDVNSQMAYANQIALAIDSQISRAFYNTPFSEVVKAACSTESSQVRRLLDVASQLRTELSKLFRRLDKADPLYNLVRQELRLRDPLVLWTLYASLYDAGDSAELSQLLFLFGPIHGLFDNQDLTLIEVLKCVAVLAELYNDNVVGGTHNDWERFRSADLSFPQRLGRLDPRNLAQSITDDDVDRFLDLCPRDYQLKSASFRALEFRWNALADIVTRCCLALPDSIEKISNVVVYLIRWRNLHSGIACLLGLENAQKYPNELAAFRRLLSTDGQYEFYWKQWLRAPALPLLPAHRYGHHWESRTHDFFSFVLYPEWRQKGNEDDLNAYTIPGSTWTDTSSESAHKTSKKSRVGYNTLAFWKYLFHFFSPNRLSPMQKGLELKKLDEELGIRSRISGQNSMTGLMAPAASGGWDSGMTIGCYRGIR